MTELIIQVDEDDKVIGLKPKEDFYEGKLIHRSAHLLLFNSENKLLIQKRGADRKWYPGLYTFSVSGTVANETYEECIAREMAEEIGVSVPFKRLFKYKYFDDVDKAFMAVFIAHSDEEIDADEEEIESFVWISLEELKKDIDEHPEMYTQPFLKGIRIYLENFYKSVR
ncbi:MAG: NUDIX domain-containing protein [Candidatus Aenigmarchaeota archaeon]|nr:NUDIX domain-containing protein [Candidatus Aenigmarchaeota archaeon]